MMKITQSHRDFKENELGFEQLSQLRVKWVQNDFAMREAGQICSDKWNSSILLPNITDYILVKNKLGRVVSYSTMFNVLTDRYQRSIIVKYVLTGKLHNTFGEDCFTLNDNELKNQLEYIATQNDMRKKLIAAGHKVEKKFKEHRAKIVVGSHLLDEMFSKIKEMNLSFVDKSSFHKITGTVKEHVVYLQKKGGRVDLSGFNIEHVAVIKISQELAKEKHIGRVRGQIDFLHDDNIVMDAYNKVLEKLNK